MATCNDCVHVDVCDIKQRYNHPKYALQHIEKYCEHFKDRSRFVELPCAVGDTVYIIARISGKGEIIQDSVESFTISSFVDNTPIILFDGIETCDWDSNDFGKQVFLTKEQAEQALKECENEISN